MRRSFSQRIALNYILATAILIVSTFVLIYLVVFQTVYSHLDDDLYTEFREVSGGILVRQSHVEFLNQGEWDENEHGQVEVNPTFIQVTDAGGKVIRKTPNLQDSSLEMVEQKTGGTYFNSQLSGQFVRQFQHVFVDQNGYTAGTISVAIPLEESQMVLKNLLITLLILFPIALVILYLTSKLIAQKRIAPVSLLTNSAEKITRENLNERIPLPEVEDELFTLTTSINKLLDRLEETVLHEKQFSSNASHELRTPLSVLKGKLDLMIRKPRSEAYYVEKATACLNEVNRMSDLVDQLLLLARYEHTDVLVRKNSVNVSEIVDAIIARDSAGIEQKSIGLELNIAPHVTVYSDVFMLEQILENIISNAIKYSGEGTIVYIESAEMDGLLTLRIRDEGIGMSKDELSRIFQRFYRVDESRNTRIKGYGLGLAITMRLAELLNIKIKVQSEVNKGTTFTLRFPAEA